MGDDSFEDLLARSEEMPDGAVKIEMIERAVALADRSMNQDAQFEARNMLTRAAVFGGRVDVAMVSFAWTLRAADQKPREYPIVELLWQYKWLTENLAYIHTISQQQMADLFADMAARYERFGSTLHAVYQIRRDVAALMGDNRTAAALDRKFRNTQRDELSNCAACVLDANVQYQLLLGDDAAALETARPALTGKVTCGEVPHCTHARVLLPYLRLNRVEKAVTNHKLGYRLVRDNPKFISHHASHLAFLGLTGNWNRATRVLNRHLHDAINAPCHSWTFDFLCATELVASQVIDAKIQDLPFPDRVPFTMSEHPWEELRDWASHESEQIARQFDARNGTDLFARKRHQWANEKQYAVDRPLDS